LLGNSKKRLRSGSGEFTMFSPIRRAPSRQRAICPFRDVATQNHDTESVMSTMLLDPPTRNSSLLRDNPVNDLRRLDVVETESEIVIAGIVTSYYLKQMAQEAVRPALGGRKLRNNVIVLPPK